MALPPTHANVEPLTSTPLRRLGIVESSSRSIANPEASLVVLTDVHANREYQDNLRHLAGLLLRSGALPLVLVEGHAGPFSRAWMAEFGETLGEKMTRDTRVSPGVLQALGEAPSHVQGIGIDDPDLFVAHRQVQGVCHQHRQEWHALLSHLEACLRPARLKLPPSVRAVLDHRYPISQPPLPLSDFLAAAIPQCHQLGIEFSWFQELVKYRDAMRLERSLDLARCEEERTRILVDLAGRLQAFRRVPQGIAIDLRKAVPLVRHWLVNRGVAEADFGPAVAALSPVELLSRAQSEVHDRLTREAADCRDGLVTAGTFLPDLISLALSLEVDVFRFPHFVQYARYTQLAGTISAQAVMAETRDLSEQLILRESLAPQARETMEFARRLSLLGRAGSLELGPDDSDELLVSRVQLEDFAHGPVDLPSEMLKDRITPEVQAVASGGVDFYRLAERRTERMVESALSALASTDTTEAIVVCGGFHCRSFIRMITTRYPGVAWSLLRADLKLPEAKPSPTK